jgi:hypothetical protein
MATVAGDSTKNRLRRFSPPKPGLICQLLRFETELLPHGHSGDECSDSEMSYVLSASGISTTCLREYREVDPHLTHLINMGLKRVLHVARSGEFSILLSTYAAPQPSTRQ